MNGLIQRRNLILGTILVFILSAMKRLFGRLPVHNLDVNFIRPPGAGSESDFSLSCIRCGACANVCEAGCIKFFDHSAGLALAGTPYLLARQKACSLCMNCTKTCPTGALKSIERDLEEIKKEVRMGTAVVIEDHCLSANGRVCGVCHDACPLKGEAIRLKPVAKPVIDESVCIGCGRCEERCPQTPTAILIERKGSSHV